MTGVFWQRVDIEDYTESQTATGNVRPAWSTFLADVEARLLPLVHDEKTQQWATPEEQAYEVQLRGAQATVQPRMRVAAGGEYYDIRQVVQPPPFGTPVTVLQTVKLVP